ncbi:D-sedoheptulose-7-phosphate isomerase [Nakamurella deserti]|uniref:D-sedoheptulose-7-phosphate isomerase n=1 Tax=Nakamurella deserti TaxID=2164074 RepID=UPI001F0CB4AC|nr:SIS domain-containing protein [Nakamurella deserti]
MTGLIDPAVQTVARRHLADVTEALSAFGPAADLAASWGRRLAPVLLGGGRLLVVGNGGSAAQAQHLSSEVVGRYRDDRPPFSAVAVHTEPSALTAIANDYGIEEMFARQVQAHGRPGDVCVLLSTSGRSPNVVVAAERARRCGLLTWAMTGPTPNPLAAVCDETLAVSARTTATVQELHLVALHVLCEAFDEALEAAPGAVTS